MDWIEQNWVLVLLGVIVVLVALWWLVGSSKTVEADTPAATLEKREEISPVVTGPAVAPIDVPPPVEIEPIKPEPEALLRSPPVNDRSILPSGSPKTTSCRLLPLSSPSCLSPV